MKTKEKAEIREGVAILATKVEINCPKCHVIFDLFDVNIDLYNEVCIIGDHVEEDEPVVDVEKENFVINCPMCNQQIKITRVVG